METSTSRITTLESLREHVQGALELEHSTPGGPKSDGSENSDGPLYLQAHHNPVFYQNVWLLEKKSE